MLQRIACLVLLLALVVPAAGWSKGSIIDPNGEQLRQNGVVVGGEGDLRDAGEPMSASAASVGPAPGSSPAAPAWVELTDRFLGWLEVWYRLV